MKKLASILLVLLFLAGCAAIPDAVLTSLPGESRGRMDTHG